MFRALVGSFVAVLLLACQPKEDPVATRRRQLASAQAAVATEALGKGDLQQALFAAELAAQYEPLDPDFRDLAMRVSLAHIAAARPSLTTEQFARAAYQSRVLLARDPANERIYDTVLAIDAFARAKNADAEKLVAGVVSTNADYVPAQTLLGELLLASRRIPEAQKAFEKAVELDPKNTRAQTSLGIIYSQQKDQRAIEALLKAIGIEDTAAARLSLANTYVGFDRTLDALPHFARATQLEPRDGKYRVALGEAHLKLGQLDQAQQAFRDAYALGSEPWASRGLGAVALQKKDFATAAVAFGKVLAMSPDEPSTLFFAAEAQEGLAHKDDAAKLYTRFTEVAAQNPTEAQRLLLAKDRLTRLSK